MIVKISKILSAAALFMMLYAAYASAKNDVTDEEHFKYGYFGLSEQAQVPFYIWQVIPEICPTLFDKGKKWESFGLIQEENQELPIGLSRRQMKIPVVEMNCSLCHVGTYRMTENDDRRIAIGAPAHELDLRRYIDLFNKCGESKAFNVVNVLAAINKRVSLSEKEKDLYRDIIIPATKTAFVEQKKLFAWHASRPENGLGRTDTFNPSKLIAFGLPDDGTIGTVDFSAIWNQGLKQSMWLHWDGNNNNVHERNYAAAMAVGATPESVDEESFARIYNYISQLKPPKYPGIIDAKRSKKGETLFNKNCASCHAFNGDKTGEVTDISIIATDRHRLDSFTEPQLKKFHEIDEPPFKFDAFRKTNGYANLPLDGLWLRGPYLHNGSVPTIMDLLQLPAKRPKQFYSGYNVIDTTNLGFISSGNNAKKQGWLFDVSEPGNGNGGHLFGTNLAPKDKEALLEFLKTL